MNLRSKTKKAQPRKPVTKVAGPRGHKGRGRGEATYLHQIKEMRATNFQMAGLYPFPMGGASPMEGVPLGRNLLTGEPVCCDPYSWFRYARLIANPSAFVMANPGLGKSSLLRRMAIGLDSFGVKALNLGDLKGEHVPMTRMLGGAVNSLGSGAGHINPLDDCGAIAAAETVSDPRIRDEILTSVHERRVSALASLLAVVRKRPLDNVEEAVLERCVRLVGQRHDDGTSVPVVHEVLDMLRARPDEVREVALDRGEVKRYQDQTEGVESGLMTLAGAGSFGSMFAEQSSDPIAIDRPMCFDLSRISQVESDLRAATLLTCWSNGFGVVKTSNLLADAGVIERIHYLVTLDELWNTLGAGPGVVEHVNGLTRLNRMWGVGQVYASHTPSDLLAVRDEEDRHKAKGIMDRCGIKILGGLARSEMPMLTESVELSEREQQQLSAWQDPASWGKGTEGDVRYSNDDVFRATDVAITDAEIHEWMQDDENAAWMAGQDVMQDDDRTKNPPPGQGKFFIKVGSRAGIPFSMDFTPTERSSRVHDTDEKWHSKVRTGGESS